jgi:hypothetical protein
VRAALGPTGGVVGAAYAALHPATRQASVVSLSNQRRG